MLLTRRSLQKIWHHSLCEKESRSKAMGKPLSIFWTWHGFCSQREVEDTRHFFFAITTGEAFVTPLGSTSSMIPWDSNLANSFLTWSCKANGTFRIRQNIVLASAFSFIVAGWPFTGSKDAVRLESSNWLIWLICVRSRPFSRQLFSNLITATRCVHLHRFHGIPLSIDSLCPIKRSP